MIGLKKSDLVNLESLVSFIANASKSLHGVRISQAVFLEITRRIHPIYLQNQKRCRDMKMNRFRREERIKKEFNAVKAKPQRDVDQEKISERAME